MLRVFISSTIKDLQFVRQTIADKIESQLGHDVIMSESTFDWTGKDIIESCLKEVRNSDVYILLIGSRAGSVIGEASISVTQAEYRQAKASKKPIFVLILSETWALYQKAPDTLEAELRNFIGEVSAHFRRNVKPFSSSEEAFVYVQAQLSILLECYVRIGLPPQDVHAIIKKGSRYEGYSRFLVSLVSNSYYHDGDYNRIMSVFSREIQSGDIQNQDFIPESIVRLSDTTGATLYKVSDDSKRLVLLGQTGDVGRQENYDLHDKSSYISVTFLSRESNLFEIVKFGEQKEYIMCVAMADRYILTLHFLVEQEYQEEYDRQLILNDIYKKNKFLFDILNHYLEKG